MRLFEPMPAAIAGQMLLSIDSQDQLA